MLLFKIGLLLFYFYLSLAQAGTVKYPTNPLIDKQMVFVSANGVTRFDKPTLRAGWHSLKGIQTYGLTAAGHLLLVGSNQGVFALHRDSGKIIWHLQTGSILYSPVIDKNTAYISAVNGLLRAVLISTGRILWTKKLTGWIYPPAIVDNVLITGGQQAVVWGIDKHSGDIIWEKNLSGEELVYRPIVLPTNKIILTTFGARAMAISATDGTTAWQLPTQTASSNAVVLGHQLFLNGFDGSLLSIDYKTGHLVWKQGLSGGLLFPATVHNGMLSTADDEGTVSLMDLKTGKIHEQTMNYQKTVAGSFSLNSSLLLPVMEKSGRVRLKLIKR